jgi:DNA polymerase III delta prime subunit
MKTLVFTLLAFCVLTGFSGKTPLSKKEKKSAVAYLKETKKQLAKSIKGLSETQLKFRAAPDRWSTEECVKHIASVEEGLWKNVEQALQAAPNPEKRTEIKLNDEAVKKMITDRSFKATAPEPFQPKNIVYKTTSEAWDGFELHRNKLVDYMKNTSADMRNHVIALPIGSVDAYQMVLFIAGHSRRHTLQIDEIKADAGFPKE